MLSCINKNSVEYQTLKNRSGIPENILEPICRLYITKYDRFPYLDELPRSNSEPYLRQLLNIGDYNGTFINTVLLNTGEDTIENSNIVLNDLFRDLEIKLTPLNKEVIVDIKHRPTIDNFDIIPVNVDTDPDSFLIFDNALTKLSLLYGININTVTDAELSTDKWKNIISDVSTVKAFVFNGDVYLNLDRASVDSPVHELMHILIGSIRFQDPVLYLLLINIPEQFPDYPLLILQFAEKSRNDANEELIVSEVSKYLVGYSSNISKLDEKIKHRLAYNIRRVLDTIFMGLDSVKTISEDRLYNLSLKEIATEINSSIMSNQFRGTINVEGSELHRKLNNLKSDLIKLNQLKEVCD